MRILRPGAEPPAFFERLRRTGTRALLLDYDGTLAPLRLDPREAVPYPGVRELLDAIMATGGTRVVLISGRWTRDLVDLVGLAERPEIWGSHGWERLHADGRHELGPLDERALQGLAEADTWVEEIRALGGRSEHKPASLAVHWRGLPPDQVRRVREKVVENWALLARESGLTLHDFDGGIELRVPGRDKGDAVRTLASELGDAAVMAYLGDDLTDEDAFRALPASGLGVLVRGELRDTHAGLWLEPPGELLDFLSRWRDETEPR
jgi:trehalose 6-phosphate phosphatase